MLIMTPADENETRHMLQTAWQFEGPALVRYPRGCGAGVKVENALRVLEVGKAAVTRQGEQVAILAFGELHETAMLAGEQLNATVVNMRFVKPLDGTMIQTLLEQHDVLVTIENNVIQGGAGSAVAEYIDSLNPEKTGRIQLIHLGLPDYFIEHASQEEQLAEAGLDLQGVLTKVKKVLG